MNHCDGSQPRTGASAPQVTPLFSTLWSQMLFENSLNWQRRAGRSSPCAVCSAFVRRASNFILKAPTSARPRPLQMLPADACACVRSMGIYKVLREKLDHTLARVDTLAHARTGAHRPSHRSLITADHPAGNSPPLV